MTTVACNPLLYPIGLESFADITDAPLVEIGRDWLTFDGDLAPEQVAAIQFRAASRDAADEARRLKLAAAVDADALNLAHIAAAYLLGRDLPDPITAQE